MMKETTKTDEDSNPASSTIEKKHDTYVQIRSYEIFKLLEQPKKSVNSDQPSRFSQFVQHKVDEEIAMHRIMLGLQISPEEAFSPDKRELPFQLSPDGEAMYTYLRSPKDGSDEEFMKHYNQLFKKMYVEMKSMMDHPDQYLISELSKLAFQETLSSEDVVKHIMEDQLIFAFDTVGTSKVHGLTPEQSLELYNRYNTEILPWLKKSANLLDETETLIKDFADINNQVISQLSILAEVSDIVHTAANTPATTIEDLKLLQASRSIVIEQRAEGLFQNIPRNLVSKLLSIIGVNDDSAGWLFQAADYIADDETDFGQNPLSGFSQQERDIIAQSISAWGRSTLKVYANSIEDMVSPDEWLKTDRQDYYASIRTALNKISDTTIREQTINQITEIDAEIATAVSE